MLADEIIDAATSLLLDAEAASAVSIRAVAERVGVTPPSIYLHFADKDALLEAVCARYFEQLDEKLAEASIGVDDPLERALQMGMAYVRFAVDTPVLYREAFHHVSRPSSGPRSTRFSRHRRSSGSPGLSANSRKPVCSGPPRWATWCWNCGLPHTVLRR
ncbi:putative TetR family transcriptional regulator [Gordonia otitidis NBRC 100426]|uniref:TetR family transcriptional regulator n=1 Tax=Gordonia otitidis (strain DSM 44809 / CCUG 52243 / JCM 12355 / NBRC 100426 / IFM 10032) TaxID=1108044 RepID=H5THR7_GORO1|nr:putative TetR family transcriptional regulator [Gordonia otitidis NBRC 100426]